MNLVPLQYFIFHLQSLITCVYPLDTKLSVKESTDVKMIVVTCLSSRKQFSVNIRILAQAFQMKLSLEF